MNSSWMYRWYDNRWPAPARSGMVSRTAAEDAVRRVVSGPERGDLLFFIGEQTDDQLSQWRILDTDGDSAIVAFVRRKAQGSLPAAAGEHYHEAVCPCKEQHITQNAGVGIGCSKKLFQAIMASVRGAWLEPARRQGQAPGALQLTAWRLWEGNRSPGVTIGVWLNAYGIKMGEANSRLRKQEKKRAFVRGAEAIAGGAGLYIGRAAVRPSRGRAGGSLLGAAGGARIEHASCRQVGVVTLADLHRKSEKDRKTSVLKSQLQCAGVKGCQLQDYRSIENVLTWLQTAELQEPELSEVMSMSSAPAAPTWQEAGWQRQRAAASSDCCAQSCMTRLWRRGSSCSRARNHVAALLVVLGVRAWWQGG
ncbi:hypothetical protein VOLCADRAFT_107942 [Volvox carteri f. nagariensis]|uniref:Uncharacterized protein n=1 Tax=Volvox carteri f. nagariensis TaxID=3068 RepID=D8UHC1_VOLCA|nr:uncharacterized protein VOLCADRAFT_107942 [Volvox carteri f. nagariensis]EFJ40878.1 hypothetical protein VOLCADRAFT_107942 [Volvox carteri f. nagariensis]|eukprot:XP_002958038.1 hypothetical protein VOLCADRAFT_107942 [Volvox carteri f. nagariensis]